MDMWTLVIIIGVIVVLYLIYKSMKKPKEPVVVPAQKK